MKKLKPVLPSLREKKRYLVFQILGRRIDDSRAASDAIIGSCNGLIGSLGMARAGIMMLHNTYDKGMGVIKVNPAYVNELRASIALTAIEGAVVWSIGLSGILKKAQKKFMAG